MTRTRTFHFCYPFQKKRDWKERNEKKRNWKKRNWKKRNWKKKERIL
jgi:hypothetical protein